MTNRTQQLRSVHPVECRMLIDSRMILAALALTCWEIAQSHAAIQHPARREKRDAVAPRFLTLLTGRNLPKIQQPREPEPSTINEKTIGDFTRVVEQTGILGFDAAQAKENPC